jgi:hypothetical protein
MVPWGFVDGRMMMDARREVAMYGVMATLMAGCQRQCFEPCPQDGFAKDSDNNF